MPVAPDVEVIRGLPAAPDLAVIASPPPEVPALVAALAARGTRAAVITSRVTGQERSEQLQQAILDAAKPTCMRILGPGCLGLMVPGHGLNVSFAERPPVAGNLALIAQSGGVLNSVLDWAGSRNIGFSHLIATGDMADVDVGDLLDYLAMDRHTRAILLHLEALSEARKFLSAARAAARARSVVVIKAGRYPEAVRPPRRPDAPVGADAVYRAAFRRAGMLEIETLDEVFDAVESLATDLDVAGDRLAIVSDSAGMAVLALDALLAGGGRPAALAPETIGKLDRVLPAHWSGKNPVDLIGDAPGERYGQALDAVLADSGNDAVLVVRCPSALADGLDAAEATVAAARRHRRPLLTSWVGETAAAGARKLFDQEHIATYATPGEAVRAFVHLACYRRNQAILLEAPPSIPESFSPEPEVAERIIDAALAEDREELAPCETDALLAAYDLSIAGTAPEGRRATILAAEDPLFGPVIRLDVEGRDEQALGLPPLNLALAYDLLRDAAPAGPKGDLALILVKVSQLICDLDRVVGLELDLALSTGTVLVRSARARIASRRTGATRLAIRPYPKELEQPLVLRDGRTLLLRPIRPEDAPAFRHMVENRTAQEDRRLRFFSAIKTLTPQLCARLTQIDYDREMALVAIDPAAGVQDAFCGVVRITADPDRERAEYAVLVRSDLKGQGLGRRLMEAMIGYARAQGLDEIFGEVLRENTPMLRLAEALGFGRDPVPDAPELVVVRLRL
jgi:acyl-CoA synthetase (NDP forming)/RimJ/RimL family protein N-acetyltransferase